jgi:hypothetical protein
MGAKSFFKASLDRSTVISTGLVVGVLIVVSLVPFFVLMKPGATFQITLVMILVVLFSIGTVVLSWMYAPTGYGFDGNGSLVIRRHVGKVLYSLEEVKEFSQEERILRRSMRTFGVGGVFGYYGYFYTNGIGKTVFFATQRKNWVWIRFKNGKNIFLTPDDPTEFLRRMTTELKRESW